MGKNKKKFIDKNNAVKFYLVHRSQRDPLYLDETLGERVLLPAEPITNKNSKIAELFAESREKRVETSEEIEKRKAEQQKFGIYFEDDYNYLQHLKEIKDEYDVEAEEYQEPVENILEIVDDKKTKPKLMLPASVFASEYEEEIGYFNQAAPNNDPKIGWDSEVVETLDDETKYNFEDPGNQLDDDFFIKANDDKLDDIDEQEDDDENDSQYTDIDDEEEGEDEEEDDDDVNSDNDENNNNNRKKYFDYDNESLDKFETKTQFTNYSMTSSVIRRNEKLKYLDEHFEKLYSQYNDDQIGALDLESEDITGYRDTENIVIKKALEDFQKSIKKIEYKTETKEDKLERLDEEDETGSDDDDDDETTGESEDSEEEEYEYIYVKEKIENPLDCESVLSVTSSKGIKPKIIKEENLAIRLSKKTGLPMNVLNDKPISKNQLEKIDHKITRVLPEIQERNKNETKEEKKQENKQLKNIVEIEELKRRLINWHLKKKKLNSQRK